MTLGIVFSLMLAQSAPSLGQGRAHVTALREGDLAKTWARNGGARGQQFKSLSALQKFAAGVRRYGEESKLVSEGLAQREGLTVYQRVSAVTNWARGTELEILMDPKGRMVGASMRFAHKAAPTTYGAYRSLIKLRLPLEDTWHVLWGGRTWEENRHASVSDMRFALDLLQREHGRSAAGKGRRNDDYFAWNQPVIAPADGVVVVADDGVPDNQPNRARGGNLYGNLIVIDHGTEEFTLLAHLKNGSVVVQPGDRVLAGQRLARVGNSGMSTEPHLHFQLMDTADWQTAHGLPLQLFDVVRNGTLVNRVEPRRGDVLTGVSAAARR